MCGKNSLGKLVDTLKMAAENSNCESFVFSFSISFFFFIFIFYFLFFILNVHR